MVENIKLKEHVMVHADFLDIFAKHSKNTAGTLFPLKPMLSSLFPNHKKILFIFFLWHVLSYNTSEPTAFKLDPMSCMNNSALLGSNKCDSLCVVAVADWLILGQINFASCFSAFVQIFQRRVKGFWRSVFVSLWFFCFVFVFSSVYTCICVLP